MPVLYRRLTHLFPGVAAREQGRLYVMEITSTRIVDGRFESISYTAPLIPRTSLTISHTAVLLDIFSEADVRI